MANVTVCCRLPHGIIIEMGSKKVKLNGANDDPAVKSPIATILTDEAFGETQVDEQFWAAWSKEHANFAPYKSGAIFVAKDKASAKASVKDKGKTGFEPLDQKAAGVKPADDK